ncbi:hypothetical protein J2W94_000695 [Pseudoxanthomonas sacheonensis]|uniref:Secreted protein n=1 Tax=Pseudoxanthomonas sacheonensis TaxID=443615 RepID=A0ABU1RNT7_9GAMM|nr:hypothetical protein [Pseudoxanthomonas sacheonensis]
MRRSNIVVLLASLCVNFPIAAAEQEIRSVCSLKASTAVVITIKITSGRDACGGRQCFASIYEGTLIDHIPHGLKKGQVVEFTTSASIQIGETYKLFADHIKTNQRRITFLGSGYETTYEVPKSVRFYVPIDGAFLVSANSYYRTVWPGCDGSADECSYMQRFSGQDILKADVMSADLQHEDACNASGARGLKKVEAANSTSP